MGNRTVGTAFLAALLAVPFDRMLDASCGHGHYWQTGVAAAGGVLAAYAAGRIADWMTVPRMRRRRMRRRRMRR